MAKKTKVRQPNQDGQTRGNEGAAAAPAAKRSRTAIHHESLAPGTKLVGHLKGRTFSATVVLGPSGESLVEMDGTRYPSLSAAGKAAAGYPVNGWRFWRRVEEGDPA
jgi:hypothetical protein